MPDLSPDWRREGDALVRDFEFSGFTAAIDFVNRVADLANRANHHPDLLIHGYKHVKVTLTTHSAGGVTENDENLAREIDEL
jgi:4a-hydroxytetrahydrobiopterin dehydratase